VRPPERDHRSHPRLDLLRHSGLRAGARPRQSGHHVFFGLAFGLGGIGSAVLGAIADRRWIQFVFHVCSYLPLIGLLTAVLPNLGAPFRRLSTAASA
jgi:hypothetical protein